MLSNSQILKFYKHNPDLPELYSPWGKNIIIKNKSKDKIWGCLSDSCEATEEV